MVWRYEPTWLCLGVGKRSALGGPSVREDEGCGEDRGRLDRAFMHQKIRSDFPSGPREASEQGTA